ncbi:MAG: hypothetical protein KC561_11180, partial [Myxococcales bacterium]|nr:hypothetical protein [Myxococcales bacterium]
SNGVILSDIVLEDGENSGIYRVLLPAEGLELRFRLIVDGEVVREETGRSFEVDRSEVTAIGHYFRVEVNSPDGSTAWLQPQFVR